MALHRIAGNRNSIASMKTISSAISLQGRRTKTSTYLTDDYQYIQRGQIPQLHFQRSLPRLPIPALEKTCERYLAAIAPLATDADELKRVENQVTQFRTGPGQNLQKLLLDHDKANRHTSYISEPWFDMYLKDRRPLPVNYNPVLIMKPDEKNGTGYNEQLIRAGNLIISTLRFMRSLREDKLEPEVFHMNPKKSDTPFYRRTMTLAPQAISTFVSYVFKAFPLDMSQVRRTK